MKKILFVLLLLNIFWFNSLSGFVYGQTPTATPRPTFQPTCTPSPPTATPVPPTATPTIPVSGTADVTALAIFGGTVFVLLGILFFHHLTLTDQPKG